MAGQIRPEGRGRSLLPMGVSRFWLVILFAFLVSWGLLPVFGHFMEASALRTDVAQLVMNYHLEGKGKTVPAILEACAKRDVHLEPKDIHIDEDDTTGEVRIHFDYTKRVKVFFVPRNLHVKIEETTTNLGL